MKKILLAAFFPFVSIAQSGSYLGWSLDGNNLGASTSSIGSVDNFSFSVITNNTRRVLFGNTGNNTMDGALAITGNSLAPTLSITCDATGNQLGVIIEGTAANNPFVGLQGINNSIVQYKNTTTSVFWRTGNSTTAGTAGLDAYYIGTSSNPDLAFYSLGTDGFGRFSSKLRIGSLTAPAAKLDIIAGTRIAGNAPIHLTIPTSSVLTTPEEGVVETNASGVLFWTPSTTRYQVGLVLTSTATLDFPNTLTLNNSDLTITVTNAAVGDAVSIGIPAAPNANSCFTGFVSAANTVTIRFNNYSALAIDPASATYKATVIKN